MLEGPAELLLAPRVEVTETGGVSGLLAFGLESHIVSHSTFQVHPAHFSQLQERAHLAARLLTDGEQVHHLLDGGFIMDFPGEDVGYVAMVVGVVETGAGTEVPHQFASTAVVATTIIVVHPVVDLDQVLLVLLAHGEVVGVRGVETVGSRVNRQEQVDLVFFQDLGLESNGLSLAERISAAISLV